MESGGEKATENRRTQKNACRHFSDHAGLADALK